MAKHASSVASRLHVYDFHHDFICIALKVDLIGVCFPRGIQGCLIIWSHKKMPNIYLNK